MDRHLIAITYLEWLNWGARGTLRVAPERLVWTNKATEPEALATSLNAAPDLEPADDAILLASLTRAPVSFARRGSLNLSFNGTQFEALSERSHRLLSPTATRMHTELDTASDPLKDAWVQWKLDYRNHSSKLRAERLLDWAWNFSTSYPSASDEEELLNTISDFESVIAELKNTKPEFMQSISGSDAYAWYCMAAYATDRGILEMSDDASWKEPINEYIKSSRRRAAIDNHFYRFDDPMFVAAIGEFADGRNELWIPLALAIAKHHSECVSYLQGFDFRAFVNDLECLVKSCEREADLKVRQNGLCLAIIALARALPEEAILEITRESVIRPGWLSDLLREVPRADVNEVSPKPPRAEDSDGAIHAPIDQPSSETTGIDQIAVTETEKGPQNQDIDQNTTGEAAPNATNGLAPEAPSVANGKKRGRRAVAKGKTATPAEPDLYTNVGSTGDQDN